ncbi:MAG: winged helix-turn-helix transcriptional regulator [Candidatus Micrarchaeales archaeon]|jgi:DNA-binding transcriptional ArsR family regulator
MTKSGQTKKKILKLIGEDTKTPGEISEKLGLAPSTVSEHMDELEQMGAIERVDNPYVKKWKYYKLNPKFNGDRMVKQKGMGNIVKIAVPLVIVLGLLAFVILELPVLNAENQIAFQLTDPPSVPNGTEALNITYSSLQAHIAGNNNVSGWISGTGSGMIDLMNLINTSQVIGTGKVPANAMIDMVRFDINSAFITINGTTYNVTVPSGHLTAQVTGQVVNGNSSVMIDLSPVVATIFTENSTVFVLVPSVKAVFIGNSRLRLKPGERAPLDNDEKRILNQTTPKISITSANLTLSGNVTNLSVTVKNNLNKSLDLRHVILYGIPSVFVTPEPIRVTGRDGTNTTFGVNIQERPDFLADSRDPAPGMMVAGNMTGKGKGVNLTERGIETVNGIHVMVVENGSAGTNMPAMNAADSKRLGVLVSIGARAKMLQVLNFIVTKNGTLVLPRVSGGVGIEGPMMPEICDNCFENSTNSGYLLQPGASATLTFSGEIVYANGHIRITPAIGEKYRILVVGDRGSEATTNVIASG